MLYGVCPRIWVFCSKFYCNKCGGPPTMPEENIGVRSQKSLKTAGLRCSKQPQCSLALHEMIILSKWNDTWNARCDCLRMVTCWLTAPDSDKNLEGLCKFYPLNSGTRWNTDTAVTLYCAKSIRISTKGRCTNNHLFLCTFMYSKHTQTPSLYRTASHR